MGSVYIVKVGTRFVESVEGSIQWAEDRPNTKGRPHGGLMTGHNSCIVVSPPGGVSVSGQEEGQWGGWVTRGKGKNSQHASDTAVICLRTKLLR